MIIFLHKKVFLRKRFRKKLSVNIKQYLAMENIAKIAKKYQCENCNYITSNSYDYKKHCKTIKHNKQQSAMETSQKSQKIAKNRKQTF